MCSYSFYDVNVHSVILVTTTHEGDILMIHISHSCIPEGGGGTSVYPSVGKGLECIPISCITFVFAKIFFYSRKKILFLNGLMITVHVP